MKNKNIYTKQEVEEKKNSCPLFLSKASCGFPSPADDFIEQNLCLDEALVTHPAATFFVRAKGDSMQNVGIFSGDLLIVDKSITPQTNNIVIAAINGELVVKRLEIHKDKVLLIAENSKYKPIEIAKEDSPHIWGVVTYVVHALGP